jgi:hypothetical protein
MAIDNPFMVPRKLDGSTPDATQKRGWADAEEPTRLTRFAMRGESMILRALETLGARADEQYGTDQIPLTEQEELMMEASKGTSDLEAEAGVFGVDSVLAERMETLKQSLARPPHQPSQPMDLAPLEEELPRGY